MQIQKLNSSKLFYNKWPYKIECNIKGATRLSYHGPKETKAFCMGLISAPMARWMPKVNMSLQEKQELFNFTEQIEPYLGRKSELQTRVEGRHFNIFCKDLALLEEIHDSVFQWVVNVYGPTTEEELNYMLDNGHKKILRDALPKDVFQYRIYFKQSWEIEDRIRFLIWANKNPNIVDISKGSREWLSGGKRWVYNPFIYVKDARTLTMVGLHSSGNVKRVEEFILRENLVTA